MERYETVEIEVIRFETDDVITTSDNKNGSITLPEVP